MSRNPRSRTRTTLLRRLMDPADKEAWREFVEHYGCRIFRWCRRGLQNADAEDLTQDLLLKLAVEMRTFEYDPTRSFHAWLKAITNNALRNSFRSKLRAQKLLDNIAACNALMQELEPEFERELLDEAMARVELRVEEKTWMSFYLTKVKTLSTEEAAQKLDIPMASLRVNRSRVVAMLQKEVRRLEGRGQDGKDVGP